MSYYSSRILSLSGLVTAWKLAEVSGTSATDIKGTNTGTYSGGFTLGQTGLVGGQGETATSFVSVTAGKVSTAAAPSGFPVTAVTLEVWFKTTTAPTADIGLLSYGTWSGPGSIHTLGIGASNSIYHDLGVTVLRYTVPSSYANGNWHHLVVTWQGGGTWNRILYFDGSQVTSDSPVASTNIGTNPFTVAGSYNGTLAYPAVYSGVLPSTDVTANYSSGTVVPTNLRVTQAGVEVLSSANPNLRLTQAGLEVLNSANPKIRLTQIGVETLISSAAIHVVSRRKNGPRIGSRQII
jgi:hypothetical protein